MINEAVLGKNIEYWLELQKRIEKDENYMPRNEDLLIEIYKLRSKVNFYETRITECYLAIQNKVQL